MYVYRRFAIEFLGRRYARSLARPVSTVRADPTTCALDLFGRPAALLSNTTTVYGD